MPHHLSLDSAKIARNSRALVVRPEASRSVALARISAGFALKTMGMWVGVRLGEGGVHAPHSMLAGGKECSCTATAG